MNFRLTAISAIGGLILAAFLLAPQSSAQTGAAKGSTFFSQLKVGQMVELTSDATGYIIKTNDDPNSRQTMQFKITEVGNDYIGLELEPTEPNGAVAEYKIPIYAISSLTHFGAPGARRPDATAKKKK